MTSQRNHHEGDPKTALALARAARIRAARAYADLSQADFATELGVSVVTIKRMERGTRETSLDDLHRLADLCKVPRRYMEDGWSALNDEASIVVDQLDELRRSLLDALDARMGALTEALLTRDEALATSRQAMERLRGHVTHGRRREDDD
jgi:transcriptional regulator with XRE-family HTH domain